VADEVERLIRDLGKIPDDLKRKLRPRLRIAGRLVADQAKLNASWSTRIPGATKVSVSFTLRRPGVAVVVDKNKAPHARPFEHGGNPGDFRHPVFGHRDRWVSQPARPFLAPAFEAKRDAAAQQVEDAVDASTRDAGFH